ncbi:ABC transporter ATP-binding protein [Roseisalinus antarcticus]|uniref:Lipopolysaccharide export system ATP-binding protein LptB n=1 Tax=Roseisalinus antarcticus TaxID=254357 RepID=A0A1Y5TT14_9RHOB|nr:ABC transporter ATP-binding protein [Roseisalinus antarcticus]SLN70802.1 Lipopolysaccharide export system ATP-binding protein LptB [Roseisalinus antarcticus]
MLDVRDVRLSYGGVHAVNGVSLDVQEGEIVGLIGTNGAGKTSLFNVITGFTRGDAGTIRFLDNQIEGSSPAAIAASGMVRTFQTPIGFPKMTVLENMLVFSHKERSERRKLLGGARPDKALIADALEILAEFRLDGRADIWVQDLSAPEMKMLEFARAMMARPKLMLLDEPAAGVNPALMENLEGHIRSLRDRGVTFLVVDHNLRFISAVCERTYAMADGKVIADGPTSDVIADPEVIRLYIGTGPGEAAA